VFREAEGSGSQGQQYENDCFSAIIQHFSTTALKFHGFRLSFSMILW
jgi:hypothetical protein